MYWEEDMVKETKKKFFFKLQIYRERRIVKKQTGVMGKSEIHGYPLGTKREAVRRFLLEKCNVLAPWNTRNQKDINGPKICMITRR